MICNVHFTECDAPPRAKVFKNWRARAEKNRQKALLIRQSKSLLSGLSPSATTIDYSRPSNANPSWAQLVSSQKQGENKTGKFKSDKEDFSLYFNTVSE